jgi:hypothetical protein
MYVCVRTLRREAQSKYYVRTECSKKIPLSLYRLLFDHRVHTQGCRAKLLGIWLMSMWQFRL